VFDRRWIALLITALGFAGGSNAHAAGTVRLNWNPCTTGPVVTSGNPGDAMMFWATVYGHVEAHKGYEIRVRLQAPTGTPFPDAWRFDDAGCQVPAIALLNLNPLGATPFCPRFIPTNAVTSTSYSYDGLTDAATIAIAATYPTIPAVDPAVRFAVFSARFNHVASTIEPTVPGVSCGGFATPICIAVTKAEWTRPDGTVLPFNIQPNAITFNDPQGHVCEAATPARAATWGAIRGQYR